MDTESTVADSVPCSSFQKGSHKYRITIGSRVLSHITLPNIHMKTESRLPTKTHRLASMIFIEQNKGCAQTTKMCCSNLLNNELHKTYCLKFELLQMASLLIIH